MAAPNYQSQGAVQTGTAALTVPWGSHVANDVALLFVEADGAETVTTPSSPAGWGAVDSSVATATGLWVYWKRATGSSEGDVTVPDPGDHATAQILVYRGCITSGNPWDVIAKNINNTSSANVSIPGTSTTVADCLVVAAVSNPLDSATPQANNDFANADLTSVQATPRTNQQSASGNGGGFAVTDGVKAAAGAFGATTATLIGARAQARIAIALKPATASGSLLARLMNEGLYVGASGL